MQNQVGLFYKKGFVLLRQVLFVRYRLTSKKHTEEFMKWKYKVNDIDIRKLNYEFITNYEFWLKSVRKCDHNTAIKYLSNFKKIVNICIKKRMARPQAICRLQDDKARSGKTFPIGGRD